MKSHVIVDSHRMKEYCIRVLNHISNIREKKKQDIAKSISENEHSSIIRKILRIKPRSVDEVYKDLSSSSGMYHPWEFVIDGWRAEYVSKEVMSICEVADRVAVSSEDMSYIRDWAPKGAVEDIFNQRLR